MRLAPVAVAASFIGLALGLAACSFPLYSDSEDSRGAREGAGRWNKAGVTEAQRQKDIRDCYEAARAMVERDARIDRDIGAGRAEPSATGDRTTELLEDMRAFGLERRRGELFERCMQKKGYARE